MTSTEATRVTTHDQGQGHVSEPRQGEAAASGAAADPACTCGHPSGWHFRSAGSCLECGCLTYTPEPSVVTALRTLGLLPACERLCARLSDWLDRYEASLR